MTIIVLDNMDVVTGWNEVGAAGDVTVNTTTKKEGAASLNAIKTGIDQTTFAIEKTLAPAIDVTKQVIKAWLYIKDQTTLDKILTAEIQVYEGANWAKWEQTLVIGWNSLEGNTYEPDSTSATVPDYAAIDKIRLNLDSVAITDTYAAGDVIGDYYRARPQNLIHGSAVSFCPERRTEATGKYGVLDAVSQVFLWSGLNSSFGIDVEETFEEIAHNPVSGSTNILEEVRNVPISEELSFALTTVPQVDTDLPLLQYITGPGGVLGDQPDSTSWLKELAGRFSLFTGVMLTDYKCEIPASGVAKETISGFAGSRIAVSGDNPASADASESTKRPVVWNDITSIRMGATANPTEEILHCISDISFGFTSEIKKEIHPESALTTKIKDVRVVSRKMFVSLKLTWVNQTFLAIVAAPTKQYLTIVLDGLTIKFGGLYFPKYVAKADPKELVGDTITCIVDQPIFSYST
jgi:hypothetical protein